MKSATEKLTQEFYKISEKLYANAGANANAGAATSDDEPKQGNVYDADYKVED